MAMTSILLSRAAMPDGNMRETYSCYSDGTSGTIQLPTGVDLRNVRVAGNDTSTAGTAITYLYNANTGVVTLGSMIATTALTGTSGGSAGAVSFTGTGGVIGTVVSGTGLQANTLITNVNGTTISVDKSLTAAVSGTININSHAVVTVEYCQ